MSSQPSPRATEHDQTNDLDPDVVIARIVDEAPPHRVAALRAPQSTPVTTDQDALTAAHAGVEP